MVQAGHLSDLVQRVRWSPPRLPGWFVAVQRIAVRVPVVRVLTVWVPVVRLVPMAARCVLAWFALLVVVPGFGGGRKGRVDRPERVRCAHRPGAAGRVDPQVTRPPFLVRLVAAGIAGEPVPVDAEQLVLVRHLGRAAGGDDREPGQPVRPAVVSVAVQQQVQMRAEDAVQVVGVTQVLVIGGGAPDRVVVHRADPQPAVPLVTAQHLGDGTELALTEPAVMLLV